MCDKHTIILIYKKVLDQCTFKMYLCFNSFERKYLNTYSEYIWQVLLRKL